MSARVLRTLLSCLLAALSLAACRLSPRDETPGARIYRRRCAGCHGAQGRGDTELVEGRPYANLVDGRWRHPATVGSIVSLLRDGDPKSPMPKFRGRLTDAEMEAVARYALELEATVAETRTSR